MAEKTPADFGVNVAPRLTVLKTSEPKGKKGRGGKSVSVVYDLADNAAFLKTLCQELKRACSVGGAVNGTTIELQGDQRERLRALLRGCGGNAQFGERNAEAALRHRSSELTQLAELLTPLLDAMEARRQQRVSLVRALLLETPTPAYARALAAELRRRRDRGELGPVDEIVGGEVTVLVDGVDDPAGLAARVRSWAVPPQADGDGPLVEVPVRYDGADLAGIARSWGVTESEAVRLHSVVEYRVAFCGFAPGFAYLVGGDPRLQVPRRHTPRTSVPSGAVALAGEYSGIYPRPSPGGWQLIGTTDAVLWDLDRDPPALLRPGAVVRFEAVRA